MSTVQELAREAAGYFETAAREDGGRYVRLRDANEAATGAPDWLRDLVYAAHAGMLPDDWRYACIQGALSAIAETDWCDPEDLRHEFADNYVDTYDDCRIEWLKSHWYRADYCDDAVDEGLCSPTETIIARIGMGQYMEASEVYSRVLAELEKLADETVCVPRFRIGDDNGGN